jgi:type IX secretion system PorP/SprF family membrane protein
MKLRSLTLALAALATGSNAFAQDIHFSQFKESPLQLTPASAGVFDGDFRMQLNYKNQWSAMGNPYTTMGASFDLPVFRDNVQHAYMGLGLNVFQDKAGDASLGLLTTGLSVSGVLPVDATSTISAGLLFGFGQRSIDPSKLQFGNQYSGNLGYDPTKASNEYIPAGNYSYADIGAGAFYEFSNQRVGFAQDDIFRLNAGIACYHVNQPVQSFSTIDDKLYRKWVVSSSMRYDIPDGKVSLAPAIMYQKQGPSHEFNIGTLLNYRINTGTKITNFFGQSMIGIGCFYRAKDAIVPQLYYEASDFSIGLAYDYNLPSKSGAKMNGGYEVAVKWARMHGALRKGRR